MNKTKICTKCGKELPATTEYFYKAKFGKFGLFATCKICKKECFGDSQKKYRKEHEEHYKELKNIWDEKNKDYAKEYSKNYRFDNKKIIKERNKERRKDWDIKYYNNNKERIKEFKYNYSKTERGKLIGIKNSQKRRLHTQELESSFTIEQWEKCKNYFNNICCYCGEEKKLTQEHFIPISKKGPYTKNNIIPACINCNSSKQNKSFFEWYPKQEFYNRERENKILKYLNYN